MQTERKMVGLKERKKERKKENWEINRKKARGWASGGVS